MEVSGWQKKKAGQWDREHQGEGSWGDGDRKSVNDKVRFE